jgi:hypothetical protein
MSAFLIKASIRIGSIAILPLLFLMILASVLFSRISQRDDGSWGYVFEAEEEP